MKIGYSYWGFLADIKLDCHFNELSTPDGNAFYSWSIINELENRNHEVVAIMPDRDKYAIEKFNKDAFSAWCTDERYSAYLNMRKLNYDKLNLKTATEAELFSFWDEHAIYDCDFILHEWRMLIQDRNTIDIRNSESWQPDYFIQSCLIKYCQMKNIKMIVFDLDYKLLKSDIKPFMTVIELGDKWHLTRYPSKKVYIPFDFDRINFFLPLTNSQCTSGLIYVGNRYERDWCIDKYIPDECTIYGNWKERGRNSEERWPNITFKNRLQLREMHDAYSKAICTILLAKKEYCQYHFMTARLIEAIFYGTIPLFIEEYGDETIKRFAGKYANLLKVTSKDDVENKIRYFKEHEQTRLEIIAYLRKYLRKMDAANFVNALEECCCDIF